MRFDPLAAILGDVPPPLMVGEYEVAHDHAGRLVFTRQSRAPRWSPERHHQNQMMPPTPPQLIEPGRAGEQIALELGQQADLLRSLRGPLNEVDAHRLVDEWIDALGDRLSCLRSGPLNGDTSNLIGLCQAAGHALRRYGRQFVQYGFAAEDLAGVDWTSAGPLGVGLLLTARDSAIRSADTDVLHARPAWLLSTRHGGVRTLDANDPHVHPVDPEPPKPPWSTKRPRWRMQARIGDWRVSIRPMTREAVLRRRWPHSDDAKLSSQAEETLVLDADTTKRLAQMIEEKMNVR